MATILGKCILKFLSRRSLNRSFRVQCATFLQPNSFISSPFLSCGDTLFLKRPTEHRDSNRL